MSIIDINASNIPDIALFASTLVSNICIYILKMDTTYAEQYSEYSFCNLYSQYGHETILNYLEDSAAEFYKSFEAIEILEGKSLSEVVDSVLPQVKKEDSNSCFYESCARIVLMDLYASYNNLGFKDDSFDIIKCRAMTAFQFRKLKINYDDKRNLCASLLRVIYQKLGYDFTCCIDNKDERINWAPISAVHIYLINRMKIDIWDNFQEREKIRTMNFTTFYKLYNPYVKYRLPTEDKTIYLITLPGIYFTFQRFQNKLYEATGIIDKLTEYL